MKTKIKIKILPGSMILNTAKYEESLRDSMKFTKLVQKPMK